MKTSRINALKLRVRLMCGEEAAMGPGKAMVLEAIERHGSISAAARELAMSYRKVWLLVDSMNRCWRTPLVDAGPGAAKGAQLTPLGREVLKAYTDMLERVEAAALRSDYAKLVTSLRDKPLVPKAPSHPLGNKSGR